MNSVFFAVWAVVSLLLPRRVAARFALLRGSDWRRQLREKLGPEAAARLPPHLQRDSDDAS